MRVKSFAFLFAILIFSSFFCDGFAVETSPPPPEPGKEQPPSAPATVPIDVPSLSQSPSPVTAVEVAGPTNSGAAGTRVPIEVPPGRKGVAPNLALVYNSNMGNGWIGVGWDLGLGAIQRSTKRGVNYSGSDYVFMINGSFTELVAREDWGPNYFGEKIERTFSKYYFNGAGWEVTTKDGTKYYYGKDPYTHYEAKQDNAFGVFKWCLVRVQDTNGNYMKVSYVKDNGEIYLDRIDYTGNFSGPGTTNFVRFYYEGRTDAPPMYTINSSVTTAWRLSSVEIYGNGRFARSYMFQYGYSASSGRSLLSSVTQYGSEQADGTNRIPFPPITFAYQEGATAFSRPDYISGAVDWGYDDGRQWADFNGDGRADYCRVIGANNQVKCLTSTGTGYGREYTSGLLDAGFSRQWVDFDRDGKADFCSVSDGRAQCALSTGTGFGATFFSEQGTFVGLWDARWPDFDGNLSPDYCGLRQTDVWIWTPQCSVLLPGGGVVTYESGISLGYAVRGGQWADFNGDGRADFCWAGNNWAHCLVTTDAGIGSPPVEAPLSYTDNTEMRQWVDVNGDGKADVCRVLSGGTVACTLSTGTGFGETFVATGVDTGYRAGRQFIDFNGDGKADFCRVVGATNLSSSKVKCLLSTGNGFGPEITSDVIDWGYDTGRQWVDFNGDGKADFCRRVGNDYPSSYVACTASLSPSNTAVNAAIDDLLVSVTNSFGGITTITYSPSSDYENEYLPFIIQTVSSITVNDDNGNVSQTNYTYSGGFYDADEREFRGFEYLGATDPAGTSSETWFYTTDDTYKGLPYMQVVTDSADRIYTWTENTYQYGVPYTGVSFPYLSQKDDYVCDGAATAQQGPGSCKHAAVSFLGGDTYGGYDSYGNITRKYLYGDVAVSGDEREERTEYYYDTSRWIVSLPSHTWVNDKNGVKQAETWFDYDTNGNLTAKTPGLVLNDKANQYNPRITYSSYRYGNPETITDARGYPTTVSYYSADNPTYTYAVRKTNYLGHSVTTVYDERFGKPHIETDANGNPTTYDYDAFGRIKTVTTPDDGVPAYAWKEISYDGLGRTTMAKVLGPESKINVSETKYNNRGLVEKASLPHFQGLETARWTWYYYDPIGRVTNVQNPDTTWVRKRYMQGRTTLVDADNHQKVECANDQFMIPRR